MYLVCLLKAQSIKGGCQPENTVNHLIKREIDFQLLHIETELRLSQFLHIVAEVPTLEYAFKALLFCKLLQFSYFAMRCGQGGSLEVVEQLIDVGKVFGHAIAQRIISIMLITQQFSYFLTTFQNGFDIVAVVEIVTVGFLAGMHIDLLPKGAVIGVGQHRVHIGS